MRDTLTLTRQPEQRVKEGPPVIAKQQLTSLGCIGARTWRNEEMMRYQGRAQFARVSAVIFAFLALTLAEDLAIAAGSGSAASLGGESRPEDETKERARKLFEQGQVHYSLGEYDHAIAFFREAYEISSAPALLFNLAQANRLKGECRRAVELYRHFLRLAPESAQAGKAAEESQSLETRCPAPTAKAGDAKVAPALPRSSGSVQFAPTPGNAMDPNVSPTATSERSHAGWSRGTKIAAALLISGVAVGSGAGLLYWWNDRRFGRWSEEDRQLQAGPNPSTPVNEWNLRQSRNDDLWNSIRSVDKGAVALGVFSAACLISSATVGIVSMRRARLHVAPGEISLAWQLD